MLGMRGGDNDKNDSPASLLDPFIWFKHQVDSKLSSAFTIMAGSPTDGPSHREVPHASPLDMVKSLMSLLMTPYSPVALRNLPQPVPNDLPEGMDGSIFTFEDAYEDLLAVTGGRPLPDIRQVYGQRRLLRQMFPSGEPRWFHLRRLQSSGLVPVDGVRDAALAGSLEHLHQERDRMSPGSWARSRDPNDERSLFTRDPMEVISEIHEQVARSMTNLGGLVNPDRSERRDKSEPDHFDDLFSSLRDVADSGKRTWDAFMKSLTESETAIGGQPHTRAGYPPETKIEETRDEHVDRFGYVHSKVTRRELDSHGNEVGRSTSYQMYPAVERKPEQDEAKARGHDHRPVEDDDIYKGIDEGPKGRSGGWFWK